MPRKKNCGIKHQQITTRLIEISIKMDDFIYHKIPISLFQAESYIKEVTSFKHQCKDERSLQVIEKLVRCMKAIVTDHQETTFEDCNMYDSGPHGGNGSDSPVYSLPDEDRTQLTQVLAEESNYVNKVKSSDIPKKSAIYQQDVVNKTINLCSDSEDDRTIIHAESIEGFDRPHTTLDVDIHKALSNLSLNNVEPDTTIQPDMECSQSILNNFYEIGELQENNKSALKSTHIEFLGNVSKPIEVNIQQNPQSAKDKKLSKSSKLTIFKEEIIKNVTKPIKIHLQRNKQESTLTYASNVMSNPQKNKLLSKYVKTTFVETPTKLIATTVPTNISKPIQNEPIEISRGTNFVRCATKTSATVVQKSSQNPTKNKMILTSKTIATNSQDQSRGTATTTSEAINVSRKITKVSSSVTVTKDLDVKMKKKFTTVIPNVSKKKRRNEVEERPSGSSNMNKENNNDIKRKARAKKVNKAANLIQKVPRVTKNFTGNWLENIRFVREVGEDEYDDRFVNLDNSWENYDSLFDLTSADFS